MRTHDRSLPDNSALDLNDFRYFVEVVNRRGFSAAARALQKPTSTVSYRIQQLERELGLTLLVRTSRRIAMTDSGEEFYSHAVATLERATEAEAAMRSRLTEPAGAVRYTVAVATAQFAMPDLVTSFLKQFPRVDLVQHATDTSTDIVADRYDFAIRAHSGPLPNSTLIQKQLAEVPWHLFAAPAYLHKKGLPAAPEDLHDFETLFMKRENVSPVWRLHYEGDRARVATVAIKPRMQGACMVTLKKAAEANLGVVALPAYICRDEMAAGRLQRVLPDWIAADSSITALMPRRRGLSAGARAFIDHIAAGFPAAVRL